MIATLLWYAVAALLVVVTAARLTRLITQDAYPPVAWLRAKWDDATDGSDWNIMLHCHWCLAPWLTLPMLALAYFALVGHRPDFHPWHLVWLFAAWMTLSYLASWLVNNDEGFVIIKEGR